MQGSFGKEEFYYIEESDSSRERVMHPQYMDDVLLWKAFRSGDDRAFMTIFDRFSPAMFNYGCKIVWDREVVKDAIQELFIGIWQSRERLGDTDSIKFYLFKSLRRKLSKIKVKSPNNPGTRNPNEGKGESSPSHEFVLIAEQASLEKREKVLAMLNLLTKRQQEALFLRYFEELNCDQIAAVMNVSKQAVYNLIHHALDELRRSKFSPDYFQN